MLERETIRYSAYFRGWCQAFGEHEGIQCERSGIDWLLADHHLGLVLPSEAIKALSNFTVVGLGALGFPGFLLSGVLLGSDISVLLSAEYLWNKWLNGGSDISVLLSAVVCCGYCWC